MYEQKELPFLLLHRDVDGENDANSNNNNNNVNNDDVDDDDLAIPAATALRSPLFLSWSSLVSYALTGTTRSTSTIILP